MESCPFASMETLESIQIREGPERWWCCAAAEDGMRRVLSILVTCDGVQSFPLPIIAHVRSVTSLHDTSRPQAAAHQLMRVLEHQDHCSCMQGYMFGVLSAFLSALAAVYTEWVMKRNNDSLYWQNMQLYTFGVAFNAFGLIVGDLRAGESMPEISTCHVA